MATLDEMINGAVNRILALEGSTNVEFIYLYGSVASQKSRKESDIDLCIYFQADTREAFNFLMEAMSVVNTDIFDIKIFQQIPLYIKIDVFKGRHLFARNIEKVYSTAYNTIMEYEEFEPRFYDYIGKDGIR